MAYPTLTPSGRDYKPGDWPVKTYNAMSGAEVRLRYGNKRFNAMFRLQYDNIADASAELFLEHYNETLGTFYKFTLPTDVLRGWSGSNYIPNAEAMQFRYDEAPTITSVRPGRSSVSVVLRGVI